MARHFVFKAFIECIMVCTLAVPAAAQHPMICIKAGTFFDGASSELRHNVVILIKDSRIVDVGDQLKPTEGSTLIDLSGMTVMPGLIDAHTHITLHPGDYDSETLRETPEFRAIYGTRTARITLDAGITSIRDVGNEGAGLADIALRDAINEGIVPGPRILTAIQPIVATGAYQLVGYNPYATLPPLSFHADGETEIRKEVRHLVKLGADLIKIYVEAAEKRELSDDSLTGTLTYSLDELKALVDEAHRAGLRVAAHLYSDTAGLLAIEAGVNSIEHGLYLKQATFDLMAKKGIYYVPTLMVYELWRDGKLFGPVTPQTKAKLDKTLQCHTETFKRALRSRVKIAFGTDTFSLPGTNAEEIVVMVSHGMKPIDALRSATSISAELLGIEKMAGTLEPGKSADIIGLTQNPVTDISTIEHVSFVMKEGKVYKEAK